MKTVLKMSAAVLLISIAISCKDRALESHVEEVSSSTEKAAVEKKDSNRKFIRTADIKFKVKNVPQATYAIENATVKFGGFVTYTNLQSTILDKSQTKISQDSTLETIKYNIENNITIRVPNTQLDTVIKTIAKQIDFLDFRVIKADDVSIQMLANKMAQNRSTNHEKRLETAIDNKGKKLNDITNAEDNLASQKEENDNKKLENLSLQDQVNFSTLTLQIYQREGIRHEMIADEKSIDSYRPHIGLQILEGLKTGWYILEAIIGFVVQLWSIIAIGILSVFLYKKYFKK